MPRLHLILQQVPQFIRIQPLGGRLAEQLPAPVPVGDVESVDNVRPAQPPCAELAKLLLVKLAREPGLLVKSGGCAAQGGRQPPDPGTAVTSLAGTPVVV